MKLYEFINRLHDAGVQIAQDMKKGGRTAEKVFDILEVEEEKIFDRAEGPQNKWPRISTIAYITRKEVNRTYSQPGNIIRDTIRAKPLLDEGELFRQATEDTEGAIREVRVNGRNYQLVFGTSKGGKHQTGGELAGGIDGESAARALDRVSGEAYQFVSSLLRSYKGSPGEDSPGTVPQRKFLYLTNEGFDDSFNIIFEDMKETFEEVFEE